MMDDCHFRIGQSLFGIYSHQVTSHYDVFWLDIVLLLMLLILMTSTLCLHQEIEQSRY